MEAVTFTKGGHVPLNPVRRKVLVTGAAGNIGSHFVTHNHTKYDIRMLERVGGKDISPLKGLGEYVEGDLTDLGFLKSACEGIDTVLHLAGDPSPSATWDSLLPSNIIGTYNAFVAAKAKGCRRLVFASSIHAVSGYPVDVQVKPSDPINPGDLYGVTKCFGESLGRYMAEQEGLSNIAIRIGGFNTLDSARGKHGKRMIDAFVSHRDLDQLINRCIDAEHIQYAIFHGISNNRFKRLDISNAREVLGYAPVDDPAELNPELKSIGMDQLQISHSRADPGQKSGLRNDLG